MKKILLPAMFLISIIINAQPQPDLSGLNVYQTLDAIRQPVDKPDSKSIITNRGLNYFLAKKLAYYISGTKDLSLYDFSTAADIVDGRFSFNYNRGFFRNKINDSRLKAMFSVGMETDALQGIGKLWSSDKKWNDDIGFNFKLSVPFFANVKFNDGTQVETVAEGEPIFHEDMQHENMKFNRDDILIKIKADLDDQKDKFIKWYQKSQSPTPRKNSKTKKFISKTNKDFAERFFKEEAGALEDGESETYNSSKIIWGSIYGYVPVTHKSNDYLKAITDTPILHNAIYRFYFNADINFLYQNTHFGSFVIRAGYEGRMTNEILTQKVKQADIDLFKQLHQSTDSILLAQLVKNQPYLGNVTNCYLNAFNLQITIYPAVLKWFGINVLFHPVLNLKNAVKYPSKLTLGIPVSIPADKDGAKRVNIEPQLVFNDILNQSNAEKPTKSKLSFGLKLGLPLGSIVHKAK